MLTPDGAVAVDANRSGDDLAVALPDRPDTEHAYVIRLSGVENPRGA